MMCLMCTNIPIPTIYSTSYVISSFEVFNKPRNSPPLASRFALTIDSNSTTSSFAVAFQSPLRKRFLSNFLPPPSRGRKNAPALRGILPQLGFHWSFDCDGFLITVII